MKKQLYLPSDYRAVQITYYLKNHHLYQKIKNLESFIKHFPNSKLSVLKWRMSFMLASNTHTHTPQWYHMHFTAVFTLSSGGPILPTATTHTDSHRRQNWPHLEVYCPINQRYKEVCH